MGRARCGRSEHWGIPHGIVAEPLLQALRVKYLVVRRVDELRQAIVRAHRISEAQLHPAAVLISESYAFRKKPAKPRPKPHD